MNTSKILRIYLDDNPRARAEAGNFNIMNKISSAFEGQGYRVEYAKNTDAERAKTVARRGYSLFHMDHPFHARALTLRKAYFYPFWRIENSAKRWEWSIAKTKFGPEMINAHGAKKFCDSWRVRLFPDLGEVTKEGFVYVALQGRLLEHRSFQSQSPLDMIRTLLAYERTRDIVVALHPGETYLPEELTALKALVDKEKRLQLSSEPMQRILQRCDYVVTQNSSVALNGFFLGKPAVLFGQIDFNHICANVIDLGAQQAIEIAPEMTPDFDGYLHWFLKETAINGGSKQVETQILEAVRKHGWAV